MKFEIKPKKISVGQAWLTYAQIPWDSQYFDNKTVEILDFSGQFLLEKLVNREKLKKGDLLFCKLPVASPKLPAIMKMGFYFVEQQITVTIDLSVWNPEIFSQDQLTNYQLKLATQRDLPRLQAIAAKAFSLDRYHLDPFLPKNKADYRFSQWVVNSFGSPEIVYKFIDKKQQILGFFIIKTTKPLADLRLAALALEFTGKGLGKLLYFQMFKLLKNQRSTTLQAAISFNNLPVLNVYTYLTRLKFSNSLIILHKVL